MANTRVYWLHTLSPTHVGTGRGVGYIDLPIHRDKVTNWPLIPGSAFKGVWADKYRATEEKRQQDELLRTAFGIAGDKGSSSNAGALVPTDARLVCLPVRSFFGTFAWCTSPLALQLLHRDLSLAGMTDLPKPPESLPADTIHHVPETALADKSRIYLEDLDFKAVPCESAKRWADRLAGWVFAETADESWRPQFLRRFAVVPDDVFSYLAETGTEVAARVRIDDESKTVVDGALWNEESIPAETILVGLVCCDRLYGARDKTDQTKLLEQFASGSCTLQIGGKATVGRGRVRCTFTRV